jgi:Zn-dependent protease with chaperone function
MDFAGQAIFHTLVAALVIEALVRLWGVREPMQRTSFRLLALAWPMIAVPALFLLFPAREGESFRDARALFAGRHWNDLSFLGFGLYTWWIAGMAAMGLALFLLDLVPWLRARSAEPPPWLARSAEGERAVEALARAAASLGMEAPPLVFVPGGPPVLFCTGTRRPSVVISRGAVDLLDPAELTCALAHELAHLERRDPALSWALMGARALMWFNPGVQVLVRALARDAERRLQAKVLLPSYFPDTFRWPPSLVRFTRDEGGAVGLSFLGSDGAPALFLAQTAGRGGVLPPALLGRLAVIQQQSAPLGEGAQLARVVAEDGTLWNQLEWNAAGRRFLLRGRGSLEDLIRMARSVHGGAR